MSITLETWVPRYLTTVIEDISGQTIGMDYWNTLWNLARLQSDDTAEALYTAVAKAYETVWLAEDAASQISAVAMVDTDDTSNSTIGAALAWIQIRLDALKPVLGTNGAVAVPHTGFSVGGVADTVADKLDYLKVQVDLRKLIATDITHDELTLKDAADQHPIAGVTGLQTVIDNLVLGEFAGTMAHAAASLRDAADSHPQAAITDLVSDLSDMVDATAAVDTLIDDHIADTEAHDAENLEVDTSLAVATHITLQAKIDSMDTLIDALAPGGTITHAAMADLATSGHPLAIIAGLQDALDLKADAADYQPTVLSGTAVPTAGLGNIGDLYARTSA